MLPGLATFLPFWSGNNNFWSFSSSYLAFMHHMVRENNKLVLAPWLDLKKISAALNLLKRRLLSQAPLFVLVRKPLAVFLPLLLLYVAGFLTAVYTSVGFPYLSSPSYPTLQRLLVVVSIPLSRCFNQTKGPFCVKITCRLRMGQIQRSF